MTQANLLHFSVGFGDWSGDGHGKLKTHSIEIFSLDGSEVTAEQIQGNYLANVKKLGFGLPELWEEYEQFNPEPEQISTIQTQLNAIYYGDEDSLREAEQHGLNLWSDESLRAGEKLPNDSFRISVYEDSGEVAFEDTDPHIPEELRLAMFIVLSGLPELDWRLLRQPRALFGIGGSLLTDHHFVGYGRIF